MGSSKWQFLFIAAVLLVFVLGGVATYQRSEGTNRTPELERWPGFTMIYREESRSLSPNGQSGVQRIELVYEDFLSWKVTILHNRAHPDIEGTYDVYDGKTMTHYDARTGRTSVNDLSGDAGFQAPDRWLVPLYVPSLLTTPNAQKQAGDSPGTETVIISEEAPCAPPAEDETDQSICTRIITDEITYTSEHLIPVKIVSKSDGVVVNTITVEKLDFH